MTPVSRFLLAGAIASACATASAQYDDRRYLPRPYDTGRDLIRDAQTGRDREFERVQLEQLRQQRQIEADDRLQERIRADTRRQADDFDRIYREIKPRDR